MDDVAVCPPMVNKTVWAPVLAIPDGTVTSTS
jgi:hypothetical protein